jgi:hypothetical protein
MMTDVMSAAPPAAMIAVATWSFILTPGS